MAAIVIPAAVHPPQHDLYVRVIEVLNRPGMGGSAFLLSIKGQMESGRIMTQKQRDAVYRFAWNESDALPVVNKSTTVTAAFQEPTPEMLAEMQRQLPYLKVALVLKKNDKLNTWADAVLEAATGKFGKLLCGFGSSRVLLNTPPQGPLTRDEENSIRRMIEINSSVLPTLRIDGAFEDKDEYAADAMLDELTLDRIFAEFRVETQQMRVLKQTKMKIKAWREQWERKQIPMSEGMLSGAI